MFYMSYVCFVFIHIYLCILYICTYIHTHVFFNEQYKIQQKYDLKSFSNHMPYLGEPVA